MAKSSLHVLLFGAALLIQQSQAQQVRPVDPNLKPCGEAYYYPDRYTCYDGNFLCPILNGQPTLRCGGDCYSPSQYGCSNGRLVQLGSVGGGGNGGGGQGGSGGGGGGNGGGQYPFGCTEAPTTLHLPDPPYDNYFYSDCHSATQVVVTSPLPASNLTVIGPRLLVAWPAGNSGVVAFFAPENGQNGTLGISLQNGTNDQPLSGVYVPSTTNSLTGNANVGISTLFRVNSTALLTVPILGSIRNIRDFTEGPSILTPLIQNATNFSTVDNGVSISRRWLDNKTTTYMSFVSQGNSGQVSLDGRTVRLQAGTYNFTAYFDYPQLEQLSTNEVFNNASKSVIAQDPEQAQSVSFLSYSDKLLAGAWRFLTYFGRDSMITLLLMQPVLSEGEGSAAEAVISAVLERLNKTDGAVCHEETIGDYATYTNYQKNITSTAPGCTFPMVDTDYYLTPLMARYFLESPVGRGRRSAFFAKTATTDFGNQGLTYDRLATLNAERVMNLSAAFAQPGGQTKDNLIHLKEGEIVGEWRDSTYGIGGGRLPYDVNTALVPASLRAIAALAEAGFFPDHTDWKTVAAERAQIWEDDTLRFFEVRVPQDEARQLVDKYTSAAGYGFPSNSSSITSDVVYHGLALDGNNNQSVVKVMNSDDCFRHFLVNATNQTQLSSFLLSTANNILLPYPAGLSNPVGMLVANPAYGGDPVYAANFTNNAYHGTVVWGWPLAMMAKGLERQLGRCSSTDEKPDFCSTSVYGTVKAAYNHLWDLIDANMDVISNEVWSWIYSGGQFVFEPLGALPPPAGLNPTESNVRQLWSLTFLAVKRNEAFR